MTAPQSEVAGDRQGLKEGLAPRERVWPLVREALAGARRDLTALPLGRAVFLLAIPMVVEMIGESLFAVADIFWVSKLGADALAAVGLTESLLTVMYAVSMGLSMGVGALVARRIGGKDPAGAARATVQAILIGLTLAAIIGITGALAAPRLLAVMGASEGVLRVGSTFARTMLGGSVTVVLLFLINAAFRGAGDAAITMRTLWLPNVARMRTRPTQLVMPISICTTPVRATRKMVRSASGSTRRCSRRSTSRPLPRYSDHSRNSTPVPRPMVVATAAPVTPSRGMGPSPNTITGPSRMLILFASHSVRMVMAASPAPRNAALIRNSSH